MIQNDGGPAFPCYGDKIIVDPKGERMVPTLHGGMSLRDWLAAHVQIPDAASAWVAEALMGERAPQWSSRGDHNMNLKCVWWWARADAKYRYMRADAMLAERGVDS